MRYKERVEQTSLKTTAIYSNGYESSQPDTNGQQWVYSLTRQNVKHNPKGVDGFRSPSAYGAALMDDTLVHVSSTTEYRPGGYKYVMEGTLSLWHDQMWGDKISLSAFNSKNKHILINGAFIKLKEQKMNLAQSLAFIQDTCDLIDTTARRLTLAYRLIKAGRWKAAADILRVRRKDDIPEWYLSTLFGWMQLARDLQGAAEMLSDLSRRKDHFVYGRSANKQSRRVYDRKGVNGGIAFCCDLELNGVSKYEQRCVVIGKVKTEGTVLLKRLGVLNPALIMWDVVRWTWIIDQFVSIGQYLDAYDATAGLEYMGGTYTEYMDFNGSVTPTSASLSHGWENSASGAPAVLKRMSFNRELVTPDDIRIVLKNPFHMHVSIALAAVLALTQAVSGGGFFPKPNAASR